MYHVVACICLKYLWHLQSEVVEIDQELQTSAANVLVKGEELVQARKVESNIASAIENLSSCLPVLTTYAKLQRQMKEKRYAVYTQVLF
jgi:hypothetical protein